MKILLVAGARPNFMKIAPIIRECDLRNDRFSYSIVHTGQHYDNAMSEVFFEELGIPTPNYSLDVGSGGHSDQTAKIMTRFEPVLLRENPDCVIVVGDVNSTMGCTIVAKKLHYKVAHVEAGLRSGDLDMPEEINRLVTDAIADYLFTTEPKAVEHLLKEGHSRDQIFFVGHVMIDNLFYELAKQRGRKGGAKESFENDKHPTYGVVTLHRPSNVDSKSSLTKIVDALNEISKSIQLIFPVHPRTRKKIEEFDLETSENIRLLKPLGYGDFLALWKDARLVLTDSGGLQEETTALGVPCLTLRENTERPITIEMGTNRLVGTESEDIVRAANDVLSSPTQEHERPPLWDGNASSRILDALESIEESQ